MATDAIPASATREAARYLAEKGFRPGDIPAKALAGAARELGSGLEEALALVAALRGGGQGAGPAPEARATMSSAERQKLAA